MAHIQKDRVRETSTTTGTGTYTLAGAVSGFQAFSVIGNTNTCTYAAIMGTGWEIGIGTYTLAGTLLARTAILASSNAGAAVNWGAGVKDIFVTLPAANFILPAGGTAANSAPLKLTTQAAGLTVPEQGAFELIGNRLHFSKLAVRRTVVHGQSVRVADLSVANTTTETEIFSTSQGANYLEVGMMIEARILCLLNSISGAGGNTLTIRAKYAGVTIATFVTVEAANTNLSMIIDVSATCRTTGGTGTMDVFAMAHLDNTANDPDVFASAAIDTTTAQTLTVTAQWSDAAPGNTLVVRQARALCIDNPS